MPTIIVLSKKFLLVFSFTSCLSFCEITTSFFHRHYFIIIRAIIFCIIYNTIIIPVSFILQTSRFSLIFFLSFFRIQIFLLSFFFVEFISLQIFTISFPFSSHLGHSKISFSFTLRYFAFFSLSVLFSRLKLHFLAFIIESLSTSLFLHQYFSYFTFSLSCISRVYFSLSSPCFSFFQQFPVIQSFYFFFPVTFYFFLPFCLKAALHSSRSRLRKRDAFFVTQFPSENQFSLSKRLTRAFFFYTPCLPFLIPPPPHFFATSFSPTSRTSSARVHSLYMRRRILASSHSISFYRAKKSIAFPLLSVKFSFFDFRAFLSSRSPTGMTFPSARTHYKRIFRCVIIIQRLLIKKKKKKEKTLSGNRAFLRSFRFIL